MLELCKRRELSVSGLSCTVLEDLVTCMMSKCDVSHGCFTLTTI